MARDRYGLTVSTAAPAALAAYVEGVDRLLSANAGAEESFERALREDPGLALAEIGRARALQIAARGGDARAAAARARGLGAGASRRERQHVEALALVADGDAARALGAIRAHLDEFPRDAMVLAPATGVYGLIGLGGRRDRNEALLALLDRLAAPYGDDWWFLGAHGFARTEALGWAAGAPLLERSLGLYARNAQAAHAWAHVLYERGDDAGGAAYVSEWMRPYPPAAQLHCHIAWHLALFELALGRPERAWRLWEEHIRPGAAQSAPLGTLADSAGFLWRGALAGEVSPPERWRAVAAYAATAFPRPGVSFADAHCAVAYAGAGDTEALERWLAELRRADAEGRLPAGAALPLVAEGLGAFARGEHERCIELLAPALDDFVRIGGSRAQRDLFEHTLLAACWRTGRLQEAEALLKRRVDRRPTVAVRRPA